MDKANRWRVGKQIGRHDIRIRTKVDSIAVAEEAARRAKWTTPSVAIRPWLTFKKMGAIQRSPKNDRMAMTMTIKPTM
jgi:hypothetical protein